MEKKIRSMFAWFLVGMIVFGVISRAADSIRIPLVDVAALAKGSLEYQFYGDGTVSGETFKSIPVEAGLKISKILVKAGDDVAKGDVLFSYDKDGMQELLQRAKRTYDSAKIAYQKTGVKAKTSKRSAQKEMDALEQQEQEEAYEQAKQRFADKKAELLEEREKVLKEAEEALEKAEAQAEEEERQAKRNTQDAKEQYELLLKTQRELETKLGNFKSSVQSGNEQAVSDRRIALYQWYYGKEAYQEHLRQLKEAEKTWIRAQNDLNDAVLRGDEAGGEEKAARRALSDAKEAWDALKAMDEDLEGAIAAYQGALQEQNVQEEASAYQILFHILYDVKKVDENAVEQAKQSWERAGEDETILKEKWESALEEKAEAVEEAEVIIEAMEDEDLDLSKELREEEAAIWQAENAVEKGRAEQKVRQEEKRAEDLEKAAQEKQRQLDQSAAGLAVEEAKEALEKVQKLWQAGGEARAPMEGKVSDMELQEGIMVSGSEKVSLLLPCYQMRVSLPKADLAYFQEGDPIMVGKGSKEKKEYAIDDISEEDASGNQTITVFLSQEEFEVGEAVSFEASKSSETFDSCIPISGLRKDNSGTYVYVIMTRKGILGEEEFLLKTGVTVLSKDAAKAAIAEPLGSDCRIVAGSSQPVEDQDRVRVNEEG